MMRLFAVLMSALMLSACSNDTFKTTTLFPGRVFSSDRNSNSQSAWCEVPTPGQGLAVAGTGPSFSPGQGELLVGFEDDYSQGADPFACDKNNDFLYRGNVAFGLLNFDNIVSAQLEYDFIDSFLGSNGAATQYPPTCSATILGEASGEDLWNYDDWLTLTAPCRRPPTGASSFSVDVTTAVRNWLSKRHDNYGFILAGPKLDFPDNLPNDNNANVTWYANFRLVLEYDPKQNPRAPH